MGMVGGEGQSLTAAPDSVHDLGRYVYGVAEALHTALNSAGKDVSSLTTGSWTGTAADEFENGWSETHSGGVKIAAALSELAKALGVTAETYRERDESNASALGSVGLNLPDQT